MDIFVTSEHLVPISPGDIARQVEKWGGCFDTHRVTWRNLLLSEDGRRTLCHLSAQDAEAVRHIMRRLGFAAQSLWSGTAVGVRDGEDGDAPGLNLVIEQYLNSPLTADALIDLDATLPSELLANSGRFVQRYLSRDQRLLLTLAATGDNSRFPPSPSAPGNAGYGNRLWRCRQLNTCHYSFLTIEAGAASTVNTTNLKSR